MKYKNLTRESSDLLDKRDKGRKLKSKKVGKILSLLEEKKERYEKKLRSSMDETDQRALEVRLKVLDTQIGKLKNLLDTDDDREDDT